MIIRPLRFLLSALLVSLPSLAAHAQGGRHLHGTVVDSATAAPLASAEVSVSWGGEPIRTRTTRTDNVGRFDFRDLPAQRVAMRVRRLGYAPIERVIDLSREDVLLRLTMSQQSISLQSVDVTADTLVDALARVTAMNTLDAAALNAMRGQTLGETIKNLPGVSVIQLGPSIAKPVIRGLNSQRVLVLNAGLRQEDQQWGTEHAPNLDSFDADAVTVVRGAATVLYGADALGGVVRVDHALVPDTGVIHGDLAINAFSNSRQGAASLSVHGGGLQLPVIGRTGYRLRLTTRVAGNGAAPDYFLENTGFRELNGSATFGVQRSWGTSELLLSRFATELGVLSQAHAGNFDDLQRAMMSPPTDSSFTYNIDNPNQRVSHTTARWRSTFARANGSEVEVVYGLQYNHRREYDGHGPLRFRDEPAFNLKLFTNSLDVRWKHTPWKGLYGTVGASAQVQGNKTLGKAFLIPGFDLRQGALYAQEEWSTGRVSITGGVRGDLISQTTLGYADAGIRSEAGTQSWGGFSGSLGTALRLGDAWNASLRLARAWRPPTVNERYAQGVHHGTAQYELGQADLDAERSLGVEASLRYGGPTLSLDFAAYHNAINDFIYLQPREPVFTLRGAFPAYTYAQTNARLRGLELAASWSALGWLQLSANANAVRGTNRENGQPLYDMPADRALLQARVVGRNQRLGAWHVGVGTTLVRKQDGVPQGTIYTLPTNGYALLSAELGSTSTTLFGREMDLSLSVNNALDTRYRDYLSRYRLFVNDAGRDVVLRVRVPIGSK